MLGPLLCFLLLVGTSISKVVPSLPLSNDLDSPYCPCGLDQFGSPDGWKSNDIWLDIVVVLDTSESMGAEALQKASALIESFISDGTTDFLITDPSAPFYSRIGVISMAGTSKVLYNLNMTSADKVQVSISKGLPVIDINSAFDAAANMLAEGLKGKSHRENTRQVVYYMTDSDVSVIEDSLNVFKETGVIIVNNFQKANEDGRAGLQQLASAGYYYSSNNYLSELQTFCKANCFCEPGNIAYADAEPAVAASGGCYYPSISAVPFKKAKSYCGPGFLAAIHDDAKGQFLQQLMSEAKHDYFWIGYEKSEDGAAWLWDDQSTNPYTNWDVDEPSDAAIALCAYADSSNARVPWGAANCQVGFPYVCQYAPCSTGNMDC